MVKNFIVYTRCDFFIFGRELCHIVVLRGPGAKKGPN